jgi:hypothetical protein
VTGIAQLRWWITARVVPLLRGPDPRHVRQRNIWYLYQDLVWLGLASAAGTYINVYAIRLGASNQLIGLSTSIPALVVVLLRIPAAQIIERSSDRKSLIVKSLAAGRLVYLLLFLLPWLANLPLLRQIPQATLLVWLVILMGIPSVLSAAGWDTFFAHIVPENQRAKVVSMRNTLTHLITLTIVPLMGSFLDWAVFPVNYQVIFLVAFVGAVVSTWHVNRIQPGPTPAAAKKATPTQLSGGAHDRGGIQRVLADPGRHLPLPMGDLSRFAALHHLLHRALGGLEWLDRVADHAGKRRFHRSLSLLAPAGRAAR